MAHNTACRRSSRLPLTLRFARKLFSEAEMSEIVAMVAADPECGDLMRETAGFRKVRVRQPEQERRRSGRLHHRKRDFSGSSITSVRSVPAHTAWRSGSSSREPRRGGHKSTFRQLKAGIFGSPKVCLRDALSGRVAKIASRT